jgi:hypothetical protein
MLRISSQRLNIGREYLYSVGHSRSRNASYQFIHTSFATVDQH